MYKFTTTIALAVVTPLLLAVPAHADADGENLTQVEVHKSTVTFLRDYLDPTVTNRAGRGRWYVWGCKSDGVRGECQGRLTSGTVTCVGLFRVRERTQAYVVWPVRMTCRS